MKEDRPGSAYSTALRELPDDARNYTTTNSHEVYTSQKEEELIIGTSEFNPAPLYISRNDLQNIMKIIRKSPITSGHFLRVDSSPLPDDISTYDNLTSWTILTRPGECIIRMDKYNAGLLHLSIDDLEGITAKL